MAVTGKTGFGKSVFLRHGAQAMMRSGHGFTFLGGGGDEIDDLAAFAESNRKELSAFQLHNTHFLEVTPDSSFQIDPGDPRGLTGNEYRAWLRKTVEDTAMAIIRPHAEYNFKDMPMLQRVLHDVLYICLVTKDGKRLGVHHALDVLNMGHSGWEEKYEPWLRCIDQDIAQDILEIKYQSVTMRRKEILSTVNRLRTFLSPLVKSLFSGEGESLNFHQIVRQQGMVLAKLNPTRFFTLDQSIAVGGLLLNQVLDACETASRESRVPHTLIIDEAEPYIGDDLALALARGRKWGLSIWLGFQNLSLMGDSQYHIEKILSQVDTLVSFRQRSPKDVDLLSEMFATANLDFTRHVQPMDLHDGYGIWENDEITEGVTEGQTITITKSRSRAVGTTRTHTLGAVNGVTSAHGGSRTHGDTRTRTEGGSRQRTQGISEDVSESETNTSGWSNGITDGFDDRNRFENERFSGGETGGASKGTTQRQGRNRSVREGNNWSDAEGETDSFGRNWTDSNSRSRSESYATGATLTNTDGESEAIGNSRSVCQSVAHRKIPLATPMRVYLDTGKLAVSIQDQIARVKQMLATLPIGECLVLANDRSFRFQVPNLPEIGSPKWKLCLIEEFKKFVKEKPCYFIPNLETDKWTGKKETKRSTKSSRSTPATSPSSSKSASSPATRWRGVGSKNSGNGNGSKS